MHCCFVPPYLLRRLVDTAPDRQVSEVGSRTLLVDERLRGRRAAGPALHRSIRADPDRRVIHTANHTEELPGTVARRDDDPPTGDAAVDEAHASSGVTWDLFADCFDRRSVDGQGTTVSVTVHYGVNYDNAFWDGRQLVFGDGDETIFERFTKPMDVLAHEFTHGVTQFSANLTYSDQPGALNESVSDVFAALAKQRVLNQQAADADWLIGEGLFRPGIQARALRSMLEPGTAYDDPQLGKDPQVGSMSDYVVMTDDNGGVHVNSGIPNRAFAIAARELGGYSWERAGRIWYDALTAGEVGTETDFVGFARATIQSAQRLFSGDAGVVAAVTGAWSSVGVLVAADSRQSDAGSPVDVAIPAARPPLHEVDRVFVRRTGGFTGVVRSGELDLTVDPSGPEVRQLLASLNVDQLTTHGGDPDRFSYSVEFGPVRVVVPEQQMPPELHRVVQIVLGAPPLDLPG